MKNFALMITAMSVLSLCMVSCSDKKDEAAPAPAAKVLTTVEDYLDEQAAMSEQFTALLASVTPENSTTKAGEIKALVLKGKELEEEMKAKGLEITEEIMTKYEAKRAEAQNKLLEQLNRLMGMADKLDPSFMEAMQL